MSAAANAADLTRTELLGARVTCLQPAAGFRVAIDAVLLAAAVPATAGETILDAGTGIGAAALCLTARVPGATVTGLDVQGDLVTLATENAALSGLDHRAAFICGDLLSPPPDCPEDAFDHVMANPPYMKAGAGQVPADPAKALATIEGAAKLRAWLIFCGRRVKPGGTVTMVHRHDRLGEVLAGFQQFAGPIAVLPLVPKTGAAAKRVLVQGTRGGNRTIRRLRGFVLHEAGRKYTSAAESVLRDAAPLLLSADDDLA